MLDKRMGKWIHKLKSVFGQIKHFLCGISFPSYILFSVFLLLLCKAAAPEKEETNETGQPKLQSISMSHVKLIDTCFSSDPLVRVQVSTVSGSYLHPEVQLCSSSSVRIVSDAGEDTIASDREMDIRSYFKENSIDRCVIAPFSDTGQTDGIRILTIQRGEENPVYPGELEIWHEADSDAFQIVNTVSLEQYLPGVVASEMPSSFGLEALKAQAVCARSYAAAALNSGSEVLSDTTSDQVYRPCDIDDMVRTACEETRGEILTDENGTILKPHYYSTGWGERADSGVFLKGTLTWAEPVEFERDRETGKQDQTETVSGQAASDSNMTNHAIVSAAFSLTEDFPLIEQNTLDLPDAESPWHMWQCELPADSIQMQEKFEKEVQDISVLERAESGYVTKIQVIFRDGTCAELSGASSIRSLLGSKETVYTLSNGKTRSNIRLLPSPYFTIQKTENSQNDSRESKENPVFQIIGSGFGHGCGMSQYGAYGLAAMGYDYRSILAYYFD